MASLLDAVNETLIRLQLIDSENALTTLTRSARQNDIDVIVQVWNELTDQLYSRTGVPKPNIMSEASITLVTDDRDYALDSELVRLFFPLHDKTNGNYITEYPGGYLKMQEDQPQPANFTGLPVAGAIRPDDGELYLDRLPTSNENGRSYTYRFEKDGELTEAGDTFPFTNKVFRAMVPAAAQLWRLERKGEFRNGVFRASMGRAARLLSRTPPSQSWGRRRVPVTSSLDPMSDA